MYEVIGYEGIRGFREDVDVAVVNQIELNCMRVTCATGFDGS